MDGRGIFVQSVTPSARALRLVTDSVDLGAPCFETNPCKFNPENKLSTT